MAKSEQHKKAENEKKFSLACLMEIVEQELEIGDIFKFPIAQKNYNSIKNHIMNSPKGVYEVNKLIEMPDTMKPSEVEYFMVIKRLK